MHMCSREADAMFLLHAPYSTYVEYHEHGSNVMCRRCVGSIQGDQADMDGLTHSGVQCRQWSLVAHHGLSLDPFGKVGVGRCHI
jgi:hypothetical protein